MEVYTLLKKGEFHPVFCEDFLQHFKLNDRFWVGAVMDGCSSGQDSHFASTLIAKVLAKLHQQYAYLIHQEKASQDSAAEVLDYLLEKLFFDLKKLRNDLSLNTHELLSTLLMVVYDFQADQAFIRVIGDGFIVVDGKMSEIDQDNHPDYLGYHLSKDFDTWLASQHQFYMLEKPRDFSISTDGIDSFRSFKSDVPEDFSPLDFLLKDETMSKFNNMLNRKYNILHKKYGFLPGDDLGIIRVRF